MDTILELGIDFILFLQSLGDWLVGPMKFFTFLGYEEFYLFVAPVILWCWDAGLGLRLGLTLMISDMIGGILKLVFHGPRPYWYDPRVQAYSAETSFGVPSTHAQNAVVVWGTLAAWINRRWAWIAAVTVAFLIGISRLYLGVHFPHDVLVGWLIGGLVLWAVMAWEDRLMGWLNQYAPPTQALIAFVASLVFIALGALVRASLTSWMLPDAWVSRAAQGTPGADPIAPIALSGLISSAGIFFGLACGGLLLKVRGGFDAGGPVWQRAVRFMIGIAGVLVIWTGLGEIFPRGEALLPFSLRYLRYSLAGLWIAGLAPLLFLRLGLAERQKDR